MMRRVSARRADDDSMAAFENLQLLQNIDALCDVLHLTLIHRNKDQ